MKIGLFFGSFNPIHKGHIAIAKYMAQTVGLDRVWLVVSPHNPLKAKKTLADAEKRFIRVKKAIGKSRKIRASKVEFSLPQPSYTINTLKFLKKKYPLHSFALIIGSDNLEAFHKWKEYRKILSGYRIYVYPRPGSEGGKLKRHRNVKLLEAPLFDISSTFIRRQISQGKSVKHLIPKISSN